MNYNFNFKCFEKNCIRKNVEIFFRETLNYSKIIIDLGICSISRKGCDDRSLLYFMKQSNGEQLIRYILFMIEALTPPKTQIICGSRWLQMTPDDPDYPRWPLHDPDAPPMTPMTPDDYRWPPISPDAILDDILYK